MDAVLALAGPMKDIGGAATVALLVAAFVVTRRNARSRAAVLLVAMLGLSFAVHLLGTLGVAWTTGTIASPGQTSLTARRAGEPVLYWSGFVLTALGAIGTIGFAIVHVLSRKPDDDADEGARLVDDASRRPEP